MRNAKISYSAFIWAMIMILAFFQNWLLTAIPIFQYLDELIAVYFILYYFFVGTIKKREGILLVITSLIIVFGLFCNVKFSLQPTPIGIATDIISTFKFLFIYLGAKKYVSRSTLNRGELLELLNCIIKPYLLVLVVLDFVNIVYDIGFTAEIRYGIKSFAFVYGSPGHIINQVTYSMLFFMAEEEYFEGKNNSLWKCICGVLLLSTLKTRAFVLIAVYFLLVYFMRYRKKRKLGLEILLIGLVVTSIGLSQFEYYFSREGTPRQMFVAGALKIVREYFPFGTGFATFGSSAAAEHYSPLYYQLGFSTRWGMQPDKALFLNDNYLPMIFAQFGLIFGFVFLLLLIKYAYQVIKDEKSKSSATSIIATYGFLSDIFLSSIQSSYLAHYSVVTLTMIFVILFYPNKKDRLVNKYVN